MGLLKLTIERSKQQVTLRYQIAEVDSSTCGVWKFPVATGMESGRLATLVGANSRDCLCVFTRGSAVARFGKCWLYLFFHFLVLVRQWR